MLLPFCEFTLPSDEFLATMAFSGGRNRKNVFVGVSFKHENVSFGRQNSREGFCIDIFHGTHGEEKSNHTV